VDSFFEPSIVRASTPLPSLLILDASHNRITARAFDVEHVPKSIRSLDLSYNPLTVNGDGDGRDGFDIATTFTVTTSERVKTISALLTGLGALRALQELHLAHVESMEDDVFSFQFLESGLSSSEANTPPNALLFPALRILDLEETRVTEAAVHAAFEPLKREVITEGLTPDMLSRLSAPMTAGGNVGVGRSRESSAGGGEGGGSDNATFSSAFVSASAAAALPIIHAIIGKKIVREAWEIEAERRGRGGTAGAGRAGGRGRQTVMSSVIGGDNTADDEWGMSFGTSSPSSRPSTSTPQRQQEQKPATTNTATATIRRPTATAAVVEKEPWEIEAEQGFLTEGGRRRARAAAAREKEEARKKNQARAQQQADVEPSTSAGRRTSPTGTSANSGATSPSALSSLANAQYYSKNTQTLSLPASAPVRGGQGHQRAFSYAPATPSSSSLAVGGAASDIPGDLSVPVPTMPLAMIAAQPFAASLRVLELRNRRRDVSFDLPPFSSSGGIEQLTLPYLEELTLEGCALSDTVPVSRTDVHYGTSASGGGSNGGAAVSSLSSHSGSISNSNNNIRSGNGVTASSASITGARTSEALLPLLASLFPSLRSLDLSYNMLTSASLTVSNLRGLILASYSTDDDDDNNNDNSSCSSPHHDSGNNEKEDSNSPLRRPGLRHLRLRGNRIETLDDLETLALDLFRGNRREPRWHLEELDVRENSVGRLPSGLGLIPLDVLLVEGNTFRVPQRKVWEREGTKGLLSWLRGRMD
jgi:hypothetical protein